VKIRRLGDDPCVGAPSGDERVGAEAGVFLVHDTRKDQPALVESAGFRDDACGANLPELADARRALAVK
jgi:hypothetical protein